jgi:hypothetical protein
MEADNQAWLLFRVNSAHADAENQQIGRSQVSRDRADALLLRADLKGDRRHVASVPAASDGSVTGLCSATRPAAATDNAVFAGIAGSGGGG